MEKKTGSVHWTRVQCRLVPCQNGLTGISPPSATYWDLSVSLAILVNWKWVAGKELVQKISSIQQRWVWTWKRGSSHGSLGFNQVLLLLDDVHPPHLHPSHTHTQVLTKAVYGMLPHNNLCMKRMRRLHLYPDEVSWSRTFSVILGYGQRRWADPRKWHILILVSEMGSRRNGTKLLLLYHILQYSVMAGRKVDWSCSVLFSISQETQRTIVTRT